MGLQYGGALGRQNTRVVSCNTTGLVRVLGALRVRGLVKRARVVILRCAADPWESHAVHAAHVAWLSEGFKGAEEPVEWCEA